MLLAVALSVAVSAAPAPVPPAPLSVAAACDVATHSRRHLGRTLTLKGEYEWDWEWGAFVTVEGCERSVRAPQNAVVEAELRRVFGDDKPQGAAPAILTGHMVAARRCEALGRPRPAWRCDYLEIGAIRLLPAPGPKP